MIIDKAISNFRDKFWSPQVQNARNITEHFSDKPYEFYQLLLAASEETEADRVNVIMAIIQPLFAIITHVVNEEHLLNNVDVNEVINYLGSFGAIPENLSVDARYDELGRFMDNDARTLDNFVHNYNLPKEIEKKFGHFELNEPIRYMLKLFELMMHLEFVRLDTAYTYRAICSSKLSLEQHLNLRLLYKTNHEGFKKLYGFKKDKLHTIGGDKIESQMHNYNDAVRREYNDVKFRLEILAKQTGINDEHLVVVLTHLRKNKNKDYIPDALIELGNLNIRKVMFTSILEFGIRN